MGENVLGPDVPTYIPGIGYGKFLFILYFRVFSFISNLYIFTDRFVF